MLIYNILYIAYMFYILCIYSFERACFPDPDGSEVLRTLMRRLELKDALLGFRPFESLEGTAATLRLRSPMAGSMAPSS